MATTLTASFSLSTSDDVSGETCTEAWTDTFIYTQRAVYTRVYDGAVTDDAVDFGTITSAKAVLVEAEQSSVDVKLQGNVTPIELCDEHGGLAWCNRNGGVTGMTISCAAAATVRVVIYG